MGSKGNVSSLLLPKTTIGLLYPPWTINVFLTPSLLVTNIGAVDENRTMQTYKEIGNGDSTGEDLDHLSHPVDPDDRG